MGRATFLSAAVAGSAAGVDSVAARMAASEARVTARILKVEKYTDVGGQAGEWSDGDTL